jgi:hypothetical protein
VGMGEVSRELNYLLSLLKDPERTSSEKIDFTSFRELVLRHRLFSLTDSSKLLFTGLQASELEDLRKQATMKSMVISGELVRISDGLADYAGALTVVKGPALSMLLFGNVGTRQYNDLDIHIPRDVFLEVLDRFLKMEYRILYPSIRKGFPFRYYFRHKTDVGLYHPVTGVYVELHCGFNSRKLLPAPYEQDLFGHMHGIGIMGRTIFTLQPDAHFVYLCIHGARHLYFRLFWLKDIADGLLHLKLDHRLVAELSEKYRVRRIVGVSLLLAGSYFSVEIPGIYRSFQSDRWVPFLVRICKRWILGPEKENLSRKILRNLYFMLLKPGIRYKLYVISGIFHRWYIRRFLGGH